MLFFYQCPDEFFINPDPAFKWLMKDNGKMCIWKDTQNQDCTIRGSVIVDASHKMKHFWKFKLEDDRTNTNEHRSSLFEMSWFENGS